MVWFLQIDRDDGVGAVVGGAVRILVPDRCGLVGDENEIGGGGGLRNEPAIEVEIRRTFAVAVIWDIVMNGDWKERMTTLLLRHLDGVAMQ